MIPPVTCFLSSRLRRRPKGYLWVADPRQVTFFCPAKRKSPKKRPPRSHRPLRGFPALLARIGARLTRRALNYAPRARTGGERHPRFLLRCSAAATGTRKHPFGRCRSQMLQASRLSPYSTAKWVLFQPPSEQAEQRSALRRVREPPVRARAALLSGRRVRLAPERVSSAGHRALCARRSDRGVFLLVAFLCTNKEKLPAVGQPPTSSRSIIAERRFDKNPTNNRTATGETQPVT